MSARPEDTLTDDELAAQAAEPLPDREVMSVITTCPEEVPIVEGDWQGGDAETTDIPPGSDETSEPGTSEPGSTVIPPASGDETGEPIPTSES